MVNNMNKFLKFFLLTIIILILGIMLGFWYFSPIYRPLPKPTGQYGVGIVVRQFVDENRPEIYSSDAHAVRKILVDLYYPAATSNALYPFQPAMVRALKHEVAAHSWVPYWMWDRFLSNIKSYAQPDVPIVASEKPYPIIISLPGIGGPSLNSDLEEIASWGYIVAAIHPPYDVEAVAFPDGRVVGLNPELRAYVANNDRPNIYAYRARAHKIWLEDVLFTLQELKKLNDDTQSKFYHTLDFDRVGIVGVSHGGAVAIDFCRDHAICKAGINMDGWTKTANTNQGFDKPFMFVMSQDNVDKIEPLFVNMGPQAQKILIPGVEHAAFGGLEEKWPLGNPITVRNEILGYVKEFFDRYLKSKVG